MYSDIAHVGEQYDVLAPIMYFDNVSDMKDLLLSIYCTTGTDLGT